MDTDLFQGVLLGLLAVGLIVLIALLATLSGIRRALEQRSSARGRTSFEPASAGAQPETSGETADTAGGTATGTPAGTEPSGYTGAGSYATRRATGEAPPAGATGGQADTIRSVLADHGVGDAAAGEPAAAAASEEPVVDSAFAAHADDPQEEPFQRDGRWWFRRGDELLLYDETSGQWQPAEGGAAPAPAATQGEAGVSDAAGSQGAAAPTQTTGIPTVADQVATYWKCPTCGAVNGSTAATCRMCFAARP